MTKFCNNPRILIIEVNWIGDVLFSTPFIRALRKSDPGAYIACLVHPRCREVLDANPYIDEIIIYDEEGTHKGIVAKARLVAQLRGKKFDTAFLLHRSFTKAMLVYLAAIGQRIGYPTKRRSRLLTKVVDEPLEDMHKVDYFLNIARKAGIKDDGRSYDFFIGQADKDRALDFLSREGVGPKDTMICVCPGGNWDPKRWPAENFARLCDKLFRTTGARIAITGAKRDCHIADDIKHSVKIPIIDMAGRTTLKLLAAIFERSGLVIANDTGSMHLAVSMKTPTIALFGPTSPLLTGPWGIGIIKVISGSVDCDVPCYDFTCQDNRCMKAITVDAVFDQALKLMGKT